MKRWLIRLPIVVLIAAVMGWLGLYLLFLGGPWFPTLDEFWTHYVLVASIALWVVLSAVIGRRSLETWAAWGLASPLLGCLLVAPPASFALIIVKGYIAFPIGLVTGVLMWAVFRDVGSLGVRDDGIARTKSANDGGNSGSAILADI